MMRIDKCPFCQSKVRIRKVKCIKCGLSFEGEFYTSPVTVLSPEQQDFVELFILNSGSLKGMSRALRISYPTVRSRLDEIIKELKFEIEIVKDKKGVV